MLPSLQRLSLERLMVGADLHALLTLTQLSALALSEVAVGREWEEVLPALWEQLPQLQVGLRVEDQRAGLAGRGLAREACDTRLRKRCMV